MTTYQAITISALLAVSAFAIAQEKDKVKIEPKWAKDAVYKLKNKGTFDIGEHHATIESNLRWTGVQGKDGYTVNVKHDEIKVVADDMEVNPPVDDYKLTFDHKSTMTHCEGGIDGTDSLRMFLITGFFAPSQEVAKDVEAKWDIAKNEKTGLGALKISSTYLGDEKVGKEMLHKFKQVMTETGTEFTTNGTFYVNDSGQVLKADIRFKGVPIPVAGGEAAGSWTVSLVE